MQANARGGIASSYIVCFALTFALFDPSVRAAFAQFRDVDICNYAVRVIFKVQYYGRFG